jgi:hypothetical protein
MSDYYTWGSDKERDRAYRHSDSIDGCDAVERSYAGSTETFINVETNRSVRPQMGRRDYNRFRPGEAVPKKQKQAIKMCMDAYEKVGIIHNVIDLMGDFASQGIELLHEDPKIQNFYRKWFEKVNGVEKSERFLNYLYRTGNVIVHRETGLISQKRANKYKKAQADDFKDKEPKANKRRIPIKYTYLNPLAVEVMDDKAAKVLNDRKYVLKVGSSVGALSGSRYKEKYDNLPDDLKNRLQRNHEVPLNNDHIRIYHYKRDDWKTWANPMIYPILDNVVTLEKMRLADMAALDGAISNVRVWKLGSLEHKIAPKKTALNKLRDILASHVGGGTLDLVWGPELEFQETNSQIYRFLGNEKYAPVLTAIYGGLGVPSSLTGSSSSSQQGFTNNFVSIKTLIERLEYGRELLKDFWNYEMTMVAKAMSFKKIPTIRFGSIILSDQASEKKLLLDLADRNIISHETIIERFNEIPAIEKKRIQTETKDRRNDKVPDKAGPYHDANLHNELVKMLVQAGVVKKEYLEDMGINVLDDIESLNKERMKSKPAAGVPNSSKSPKGGGGRPGGTKDTTKRSQKTVKPRSSASLMLWGTKAQEKISDCITPLVLEDYNAKNVRSLSKEQCRALENTKFNILSALEPMKDVTEESIGNIVVSGINTNPSVKSTYNVLVEDFINDNGREPTIPDKRQLQVMALVFAYND